MSNNDKKRKEILYEEYNKAMKEMEDKSGNPMSAVYLFMLLFTIGIILLLFDKKLLNGGDLLRDSPLELGVGFACPGGRFIGWLRGA